MREMQFSIFVLMILMSSALIVLLPGRMRRDAVVNPSRWLMVGAFGMIGVQFLIQYITQLRTIGVTQAVLVNLTFFVPASAMMSLSVLNLQRQGRLRNIERWGWLAVWLLILLILAVAVKTDGHPLMEISSRVRWAEVGASVAYAAMQAYYSIMQFKELMRMQAAIEDYFDREHSGLIRWMKHAIAITGLMAMLVPILIFAPNIVLIIYALIFFWGIFMMWFCFVRYFFTNAMSRVREAEESAEESAREEQQQKAEASNQSSADEGLSSETMQHVSQAVEHWLATGAHLTAGITSPLAAEAMNIPRYLLTAWVKALGHNSFTRWITTLRIEEAKRVLKEHPDWNNEAVADHCGFSRAYFQKIFKQETGVSPIEFVNDKEK